MCRVEWFPIFFFSMPALQRNTTSVLPLQQRLHKLRFLQKMGCQKPCWDQARLSSLVNKPVGTWLLLIICHALIDAPENLPNSEHFPHWGHF